MKNIMMLFLLSTFFNFEVYAGPRESKNSQQNFLPRKEQQQQQQQQQQQRQQQIVSPRMLELLSLEINKNQSRK